MMSIARTVSKIGECGSVVICNRYDIGRGTISIINTSDADIPNRVAVLQTKYKFMTMVIVTICRSCC